MGEIRVKTADGWQTFPSHQKTSTGWKDIPTHTMTANGWQGELTSQSPLEFKATGQSLLDWRIDGASGGVGDWDETTQRYVIPVNVRGRNLFPSDIAWYRNNNSDPNNHADSQTGRIKSDVFPIYFKTSDISVTMFNPPSISDFTLVSIRFYSSDLTYLGNSTSIIPEGAKYVSLLYGSDSGQIDASTKTALANAQISVTNSQTAPISYEPYINTTTNLYTDAQLMDGDSLDYTTDQTSIPITQGDNTLTVETAVQPDKVFVKFEG